MKTVSKTKLIRKLRKHSRKVLEAARVAEQEAVYWRALEEKVEESRRSIIKGILRVLEEELLT